MEISITKSDGHLSDPVSTIFWPSLPPSVLPNICSDVITLMHSMMYVEKKKEEWERIAVC